MNAPSKRNYFAGLSPQALASLERMKGGPIPREEGGPLYPDNLNAGTIDPATGVVAPPANDNAAPVAPTPPNAAPAPPVDKAFVAGFGTHGDVDPAHPTGAPIVDERDEVANGRAVPVMPGHTVPAHWQPGSHEVHMQHGYSDEELAPYAAARGEQLDAGERALETDAAIAQQKGIRDASYSEAYAQQSKEFHEQAAAIEERKQRYVDMERQKLDELALHTQQTVDPAAYWKEKGTFAQVIGAIAMGLGQFGASISGGENTAFKIIQSKIDANIRAQETNIAGAHKAFDTQSNLYAKNLEAFGDREKALRATRVNYLDAVGAELDSKLANESLPLQERERAQKLREMVAKQRADVVEEFTKLAHTQVSEAENERFVPAQTVGGGVPKGEASNVVTLPDGTKVQMQNEKGMNEAVAKIQVLDKVQRINNEAMQLRKQLVDLNPLTDRTEYEKRYTRLQDLEQSKASILSTAHEQGVLREPEYERMVKYQTHLTRGVGLTKGVPLYGKSERDVGDALIQMQNKTMDEDMRAFVKAGGGHIVQGGYASDATGNLKPVTKYTGQDVHVAPGLPPPGFKPMDSRKSVPTASPPVGQTTPTAPYMGQLPAGTSATGKGGKGKKGDRLSTKRIK